jgi:hypothetical protein
VADPPELKETSNSSRHWDFAAKVRVIDPLSGYAIEGILEGFTPGEVTVSLAERMSEQRTVRFIWILSVSLERLYVATQD